MGDQERTHVTAPAVTDMLSEPHHDPSAMYCSSHSPQLATKVDVRVLVPHGRRAKHVVLRVVRDGEPHVEPAVIEREGSAGTWWHAPLDVVNLVSGYRFFLDGDDGSYAWLNGTGVHDHDVTDAHDFRLIAGDPPPEWTADAVVYQIFPDRFARSGVHREPPAWGFAAEWDDPVIHKGPDVHRQWFGGDLAGIEAHLDHIVGLGATVIYLTPVFEARSNHRYDAVSFEHVDPLLGGDEALARLTAAARARGLRVLGDITTNHTGNHHEWFLAAQTDANGPEAGYYRFSHHPDDYTCWWDIPSLPKLDHGNPELRRRLYGPESVVARWLEEPIGLDGWRIDVANMTGRMGVDDLTREVARQFRETMRAVNPGTWLVAEHGHDYSQDVMGGGWHGSMNYSGFTRPVWSWLNSPGHGVSFLGLPMTVPTLPGTAAARTIREYLAAVPWRSSVSSFNLLCSHDTPRVRTIVRARDRQIAALALLATMPGVPMIFMGDELGMTGVDGEDARRPMPWNSRENWDSTLLDAYRSWLGLRRRHVALRRGGLRWVHVGADSLTYLREHPEERLLVHVARADHGDVRLPYDVLGTAVGEREAGVVETLIGEDPRCPDAATLVLPGHGPAASVYRIG